MDTPGNNAPLQGRVRREKLAHTEDDVLARSLGFKQLFRHVLSSPTIRRFEQDFSGYMDQPSGKRVLDLGCGMGLQALALLRDGASVDGIDISENYVSAAAEAARKAGFPAERHRFQVMDAHALTFEDNRFDLVVGRGILHHLDMTVALAGIKRILKPGGMALFREPLGDNPALRLFRFLTPSARTVDEKPLSGADLRRLGGEWNAEYRYYGLLSAPTAVFTSIVLRPFDDNALLHLADRLEQRLNRRWSALGPWNQYVLLRLQKPAVS
jgi:ubiquinone/menaquinone biosynthesis C-methylase UbiE